MTAAVWAARLRSSSPLSWPGAARLGLAAMFAFTGASHFIGMRAEMVSMVPPGLAHPEALVSLTGILELAGAAGLLWRRTTSGAAVGLAVLLCAMYPANLHAALSGLTETWSSQLIPRTIIQLIFLAVTAAVAVDHRPASLRARESILTKTAAEEN
ncbi:DoxX family membrane protein [Microbacterium sp. CIAB417]|uniref:DoxX family membrane protein n=1 Tax=Microbacterium sp. CIAB417 TaxID=2860287 RepID=UPI001FABB436|nr:DoxX family protein [Microbacterium sp. CIAB417]